MQDVINAPRRKEEIDYFEGAPLGRLVYDRTYSRTKEDDSKEAWPETVRRVINGNCDYVDEKFLEEREREELFDLIVNRKMIPAGRHLWVCGIPGRNYIANCHISSFDAGFAEHGEFSFSELMKGGGVGTNYSSKYLEALTPPISRVDVRFVCNTEHRDFETLLPHLGENSLHDLDGAQINFQIPDTREGWVEALGLLIRNTQVSNSSPVTITFDVSLVRPYGEPIKGFGGTASGPLPLVVMLKKVAQRLYEHVSCDYPIGKISPLLAMDIDHYVAEAVIAGNVRRSARMSIMHWNDPWIFWFLKCKDDYSNHWSTNISVEIDNDFFHALNSGEEHATTVYEAVLDGMLKNGEPGFYNSSLASKGENVHIASTNPCLTGDTVISTVDGPRTFESLAKTGQDVLVYAWHPETKLPVIRMMRRPHKTATDVRILEVEFDSGLKVRCTPDHSFYSFRGKKVQAKDLKIGKSVRAWSMSEHTHGHLRVHGWDNDRNLAAHQWVARMVYENFYGPIPEGFVVHHKDENKQNNHIANLECLTEYEHQSEHYPARLAAGFHRPENHNVFYGNQYTKNHKVVGIREAGTADVYNGTVDDAHTYIILDPEPIAGIASGIVSANCGEMAMEPWENCCLGHVNLAFGSDDDHRTAFRLMARFLVRATFADFQDPKQREAVDRNRRIGVGFFGLQEWLAVRGIPYSQFDRHGILADNLATWYDCVRTEADSYADALGIPRPIKVSTLAPTGSIAKLAGTSESAQAIYAKYYIRKVRYSEQDPEVPKLRERGVPLEPCIYTAGTLVASFPCRDSILDRVPERYVEEQSELGAATVLALQAYLQRYYVDNAISMTVNIPQLDGVADWVHRNNLDRALRKYLPHLKGATVFPEASRPQSPITKITEAEYHRLQAQINPAAINAGNSEQLLEECQSGACPIR